VQEGAIGDTADDQTGSSHPCGVAEEPGAALGTGSADNALPVQVVAGLGDDLFALTVKEVLDRIVVEAAHRVPSS
jgi:hypothetical protein